MELTTYFDKFKAIMVVKGLTQSTNGHAVVEILCRDQKVNTKNLDKDEKTKYITDGNERIIGMQLIMNVNHDTHGTLIKDYDREYLSRNNQYPKTLQDAYNPLKR